MKYLFSLFLLVTTATTYASKIIITYPQAEHRDYAQNVRDIFIRSYKVPMSLIQVIQKEGCSTIDKRFLELCILDNYELKKIDNINEEEIRKSLLIFSKTTKVNYDY